MEHSQNWVSDQLQLQYLQFFIFIFLSSFLLILTHFTELILMQTWKKRCITCTDTAKYSLNPNTLSTICM